MSADHNAAATTGTMQKEKLFITASFTAEPLGEVLNYWMEQLGFPLQAEFAPYNQIFQQLLDPGSGITRNKKGVNIVLLRLEDWSRFEKTDRGRPNDLEQKTRQNAGDLVQALRTAASRSTAPLLVCVCPASLTVIADAKQAKLYSEIEAQLASDLEIVSGVTLILSAELMARYPVRDYYDAYTDEAGHIPYTSAFFTALATMLARKVYSLRSAPRKVIVLDCDNTLWKGICGEEGPLGVTLTAAHRALQEFMVAQQDAGRLLCLCSKNNEKDVLDVFAHHPEMPLKLEHILSRRINWQPKSENLIALSKELQLGLDSFIFLDDSPAECAEVQAACPEVITLQLPAQPERIAAFLQHAWPFDILKITGTDRERTALYRQNLAREQARQEAATLKDFLATLELRVHIAEMRPEHLERVAELTQRTNQFNLTTIRRTEREIQNAIQEDQLEFLVVDVQDRFGDYGLVGVVAFHAPDRSLWLDTFLLSCRVLGRGVEYQILRELGKIARAKALETLTLPFIPTSKNQPALEFIEKIGGDFRQPDGPDRSLYILSLDVLESLPAYQTTSNLSTEENMK